LRLRIPRAALPVAAALILGVLPPGVARSNPPAGAKWEPILELSDEFNGTALNAGKWYDHNPHWRGRQPGFFSRRNVAVTNGQLQLTARVEDLKDLPEGYHTFTTAAVKSRIAVKYGYFEIKCRAMKSRASSAFWFYQDTKEEWTEIDVFEICGVGKGWSNRYHMNAHVFRSPTVTNHLAHHAEWSAPFAFADGFHVYALEWDRAVIRWYVDGRVVRELPNTHWHQPLFMNFDSETMPGWFGLPDKADLPSTFRIDYVRSWRRSDRAR
jgi:beta-glucanase (GH16 family)